MGINTECVSWHPLELPLGRFSFGPDSMLPGGNAMFISNTDQSIRSVFQKIPFQPDLWQRFYFRIDSCGLTDERIKSFPPEHPESCKLLLGTYAVTEQIQREKGKEGLLQFRLDCRARDKAIFLVFRYMGETEAAGEISLPVGLNRVYCVETHETFFAKESISIDIYLDGVPSGSLRRAYYYPLDFFKAVFSNDIIKNIPWRVSMNHFAISSTRLFSIPFNHPFCTTRISENQIAFRVSPECG